MAKKSYDQKIKDRWRRKRHEKTIQTMSDIQFNKSFGTLKNGISLLSRIIPKLKGAD